jgi:hypothetical protein
LLEGKRATRLMQSVGILGRVNYPLLG